MILCENLEYGIVKKNKMCLFYNSCLSMDWVSSDENYCSGSFIPKGSSFGEGDPRDTMNCVQQFLLSSKAAIMNDLDSCIKIISEKDPTKQAAIEAEIKNCCLVTWDKHKEKSMYFANYWKFTQNPLLKEFLLSFNRHTVFVNSSQFDLVWGTGLAINDSKAHISKHWLGKNLLGKSIQRVHRELWENKN